MAIAVISGLLVSTLLTLFVVPVIYSMVETAKVRLVRSKRDEIPEDSLQTGSIMAS